MAGRTPFSPIFSGLRKAIPYATGLLGGWFGGPGGATAGYGLGNLASQGIHALSGDPMQRGVVYQNGQQNPQQTTQYGRYGVTNLPDGARMVNMPTRTPTQEARQEEMATMGMEGFRNLPSADFGPIRQQAEQEYRETVLPQLIEQFVGAGPGATRTSGFQQALGSSQAGLQSRLAAMQQQFNQGQRGSEFARSMSLLGPSMQQQFVTDSMQPQPSDLAPLVGSLGGMAIEQSPNMINALFEGFKSLRKKPEDDETQSGMNPELLKKLAQYILMMQSKNASLRQ